MERGKKVATFLGLALIGWGYCGGLIMGGQQFLPISTTLIVHAVGAPIGFGLISWYYHTRFGFTRPLYTAALMLGVVVLLDLFVVALLIEKSFAMFRDPLGIWIPFALIFLAVWGVGRWVVRHPSRMTSAGA